MKTPTLQEKVQMLKGSPYFSNSIVQKQFIFLVVAGVKPASSAISSHKDEGGHLLPDDEPGVRNLLNSLGLYYKIDAVHALSPGDMTLVAYVSTSQERADKLFAADKANNEYAFGLLAGFPKSAADAWRDNELLPQAQEAALYKAANAQAMPDFFRLSKKYYRDEFNCLRSWWNILKQYELLE